MWNQTPSEKMKIEYKLNGFVSDDTSWLTYSNYTDIFKRFNPSKDPYG